MLHHFATLALVTSGAPPVLLSDCRIPWPPTTTAGTHESCCSQVVKVGEDIQKAIDKLDGIGGCVCLTMGVHHIRQPLHIKQENLTIHGEVPWVTIRLDAGGPHMLGIDAVANVSVEGILFEAPDGSKQEPMISVDGVTGGRIADCAFRITGEKASPAFQAIGIQLTRSREYAIESVEMTNLPYGVWGASPARSACSTAGSMGPARKPSEASPCRSA